MADRRLSSSIGIGLFLLATVARGAEPVPVGGYRSGLDSTSVERSDEARAELWGLDGAEWRRYRSIMQGPLGLRLPNADPLFALLMQSDDPAEKRRYAERLVRQETAYWDRLLEANRLYGEAHARLYPDTRVRLVSPEIEAGGRILFFIPRSCPACRDALDGLVRHAARGVGVDLFFLERSGEAIRIWAREASAEVEGLAGAIDAGTVTLNVEGGRLVKLGGTAPAFFYRAPGGVITALEAAP